MAAKKWLWGNTDNSGDQFLVKLGRGDTNLPGLSLIKFFATDILQEYFESKILQTQYVPAYHHSHFLGHHLYFTMFFTCIGLLFLSGYVHPRNSLFVYILRFDLVLINCKLQTSVVPILCKIHKWSLNIVAIVTAKSIRTGVRKPQTFWLAIGP